MDALYDTTIPLSQPRIRDARQVTLGLQGGGAHGAFEWGVLDRLLDVPELEIATVSGVSAGAMNAAMLVQGLATGGSPEAKRLLHEFWRRVAAAGGSFDLDLTPWPWSLSGAFEIMRRTSKVPSPLGMALGLNPLRGILDGLLEPSAFGQPGAPALVVAATHVRTGAARLFRDTEVTADALLASACLPQLFPAVDIDGEAYWDGGYSSNPPLRPLIEAGAPSDIILVRTTPLERPELPRTPQEVQLRTTELAFGSALREELRSLAVAQRLLAELPAVSPALARLRDARLHMIVAEDAFRGMQGHGALDPTWSFLRALHQLGVETAERWLADNLAAVGARGTVDLRQFAGPSLADAGAPAEASRPV